MAALCKGAVPGILPALFIQVLQHSMAICRRITIFAVAYAVTHRPAHVIHYAGGDSFDARIHGCRIQRHTAPAADPKDANAVTVDLFLHAQEINRGAKVFGVDVR